MLALIQRVLSACVKINQATVAEINQGLLVFVGIAKQDRRAQARQCIDKCLHYRIFSDEQGKMNLNVIDIQASMLVVPQFTLMANTTKGLRPGFSQAAAPKPSQQLFTEMMQYADSKPQHIVAGTFGADMQVTLVNDGPATFLLEFNG